MCSPVDIIFIYILENVNIKIDTIMELKLFYNIFQKWYAAQTFKKIC